MGHQAEGSQSPKHLQGRLPTTIPIPTAQGSRGDRADLTAHEGDTAPMETSPQTEWGLLTAIPRTDHNASGEAGGSDGQIKGGWIS